MSENAVQLGRIVGQMSLSERSAFVQYLRTSKSQNPEMIAALVEEIGKRTSTGQALVEEDLWDFLVQDKAFDKKVWNNWVVSILRSHERCRDTLDSIPLFQRLYDLTDEEHKEFGAYISSSGVANLSRIISLYGIVHENRDACGKWSRSELFKAWQPKLKFDGALLRQSLTSLNSLLAGWSDTMDNTKLYRWLSEMPEEDRSGFLKYANSCRQGSSTDLLAFLEIFLKMVDSKQPKSRTEFFVQWKGKGEAVNDLKINRACNTLIGLLRDYIAVAEVMTQEADRTVHLMQYMGRLNLDSIYDREFETGRDFLKRQSIDTDYYTRIVELEETYLARNRNQARSKKSRQSQSQMYAEVIKANDFGYLLRLLRYAVATILRMEEIERELMLKKVGGIAFAIQVSGDSLPMVHKIYMKLLHFLSNECKSEEFKQFRRELNQERSIGGGLRRELYLSSVNVAVRHVNQRRLDFLKELAEIYKDGGVDSLRDNGMLSPQTLKNIVTAYLWNRDIAAAKNLLVQEEKKGEGIYDGHVLSHLHGLICFYRREFSNAKSRFNEVIGQHKDKYFNIDSYLFYWLCIFELKDFGQASNSNRGNFASQFETYKKNLQEMVRRKGGRKPDIYWRKIGNLISFVCRLKEIESSTPSSERIDSWKSLLKEIESEMDIYQYVWLRRRCEESPCNPKRMRKPKRRLPSQPPSSVNLEV